MAAPGQGAPGQPPWHASAQPWLSPWQPEKTKKYWEQFLVKNHFLFTKLFSHFIIIFYFVNVACFHAKLYRVRRLPQGRQPNLWRHLTRFDSTTKWKNRHRLVIHAPMGIGASFWWRDAFHYTVPHQPFRNREETLESGNLFSDSWNSASVPLSHLLNIAKQMLKTLLELRQMKCVIDRENIWRNDAILFPIIHFLNLQSLHPNKLMLFWTRYRLVRIACSHARYVWLRRSLKGHSAVVNWSNHTLDVRTTMLDERLTNLITLSMDASRCKNVLGKSGRFICKDLSNCRIQLAQTQLHARWIDF